MPLSIEQNLTFYRRKLQFFLEDVRNTRDLGKSAAEDSEHISSFKIACADLDDTYKSFRAAWDELEKLNCVSEGENIFPVDTDTAMFKTIRRYRYECFGLLEALNRPQESSLGGGSRGVECGELNLTQVSRLRLPQIKIPDFDGQPEGWPLFKATFVALVHDDKSLSNVERYHLLIGSLKGDALALIRSIPIATDNYDQTWQLLLKTYDNPRKLATSYLQKLVELNGSGHRLGVEGLRKYLLMISEGVKSLRNLKITDLGDFVLFFLAMRGLDLDTRKEFELQHADIEFPTCDELVKWLESRLQALTMTEVANRPLNKTGTSDSKVKVKSPNHFQSKTEKSKLGDSVFFANAKGKTNRDGHEQTDRARPMGTSSTYNKIPIKSGGGVCVACKGPHSVMECPKFLEMNPKRRRELLGTWRGCYNCLTGGHYAAQCSSKFRCKFCGACHHSLLHVNRKASVDTDTQAVERDGRTPAGAALASLTSNSAEVILGTVRATVVKDDNSHVRVRLVVDPGSQYNFITLDVVQRLKLRVNPFARAVVGVNQSPLSAIQGQVEVKLRAPDRETLEAVALVVPSITRSLPQVRIPHRVVKCYKAFQLADPSFHEPGPIDFLLGAELFPDIVTGAPIEVHRDRPKLLPTVFGHVAIGRCRLSRRSRNIKSRLTGLALLTGATELEGLVERFWEQEEVKASVITSPEDIACETHFRETHYRLSSGRYSVALPFRNSMECIVPARFKALKRLESVESKLNKNKRIHSDYHQFMREYRDLGHMSFASAPGKFLIPHHAVYKTNSDQQQKIRVVFDAAFKSSSGSLNEHLMVGPRLQKDIAEIVLNFRRHPIVITCDVVKMYRQIQVHPEHRSYQHILWRDAPELDVQEYELNTITYGLSCSPFLALRVITQLIEDEGKKYPLAAVAIKEDIYVDDVVTGSDSLERALQLKNELVSLFSCGGFELGKWTSNRRELLDSVADSSTQHELSDTSGGSVTKVLGLSWDSLSDAFLYNVELTTDPTVSKRGILSTIARIYDPLGYLAPITFWAKHFLQVLWRQGFDWDDSLPWTLEKEWNGFWGELASLHQLRIPRQISALSATYEVIGFCDASERGYGAALYLRTRSTEVKVYLLKAKTRLAPLKVLTIPRLELCGALLLTRLLTSVKSLLNRFPIEEITLFTDATVVLGWLHTPTYNLKTFVAHRVGEILEVTKLSWWRHVRSEENPADLCSRGLLPKEFLANCLWFSGPIWLGKPKADWPRSEYGISKSSLPELKSGVSLHVATASDIVEWSERFSSLNRLSRSFAYVLRFVDCLRRIAVPVTKSISAGEFSRAQQRFILLVQEQYFSPVEEPSPADRSLYGSLNVFRDERGFLRVGGRLSHAELTYDQRFPILLPKRCHFTMLMIDQVHRSLLHAGPAAMQRTIQERFWVPALRSLLRHQRSRCVTCIKAAGRCRQPYMGDLPYKRVAGLRAFSDVGVDFAGPFLVRETSRRRVRYKTYLCLFVCFSTKALHLELVSALTTEAFLDALDRFISRRGVPLTITSDCGSNFVGAAHYLNEVYKWFESTSVREECVSHTVEKGIRWNFNPPRTPHFGGLWEAAVKSVKSLLFKELGNHSFTWVELETLFCRIEAILNSRPMIPMSSDPTDLQSLTPAHFLIGQPLTALPEEPLEGVPIGRLSRWQLLRERTQYFWKRWRSEYLNTLQQRTKWYRSDVNLREGDLVVVNSDNTPPLLWPLGRVVTVHPGDDGIVRVVSVRTAKGIYTRPVVKLIPLLCHTGEEK